MAETPAHIDALDPKDAAVVRIVGGVRDLLDGIQEKYSACAAEKEQYRQEAQAACVEPVNVVADGMQGELVAVFNALHARGMFTCTKKELMQLLSTALGCPGLADYSRTLSKIKQANKYEDIFDELRETAFRERDKND